MKISFVIITWNGLPLLKDCLSSLEEFEKNNEAEIIITDNGSADGTVDFLKAQYPHVKLISLPYNTGVAHARNQALTQATGDYIFIIDNDIVLNSEAIEGMRTYMNEHADVGLCGCKLIDAQGHVQPSCRRFPGIVEKISNIWSKGTYHYSYKKETMAQPFEPEYLIGACQFIRRQAFDAVGLLDEHIFYGPEDADFCLRIKKNGWRLAFLPQFTLFHHCQRMTNRRIFSPIGRKHILGLLYLYWKHKRILY